MGVVLLRSAWPIVFDAVQAPDLIRGHEVHLSLSVAPGELVSLEAPEKLCVYLADLLHGREEACGGEVYLMGRALSTFEPSELEALHRDEIASIRGFPIVDDSLTVREGLVQLLLLGGKPAAQASKIVDSALDGSGLAGSDSRYPADLVASQLRWLCVLQAVVKQPRILLVESEALGADADRAEEILFYLRGYAAEFDCAVLWTTSWVRGACLADRVYLYHRGGCVDADEK